MAQMTAALQFNFDNADLNRLVRYYSTDTFLNDVNAPIGGKVYQDIYQVVWTLDGTFYSSIFGGFGIGVTPGSFVTGTATGYIESYYSGAGWTTAWGIQDVSVSANSIYQAALTPSTVDDYTLLRSMLGGNDSVFLSPHADFVRTFGGDDFIDGGAGLDISAYSGPSSNYKLIVGPASAIVQDKRGSDGIDTLVNVEKVQFIDQTLDVAWFTQAAKLSSTQFAALAELYIATFNRAPDALGLDYWASQLSLGMSLPQIAASFFVQPETLAAYPVGQATTAFVNAVYQNVLGRESDVAGLNYWVGEIQNGHIAKDIFLLAIINGALAPSGGTTDAQYLLNKAAVGLHYALTQGLNNATWARTVMAGVDSTTASVTTANQLTDTFAASAATANSSELVIQILGIAA